MPILGSLLLLAVLSTLFIAANLSIGYTFSTVAQNQLQAMQMSMMFFLPNILLSGFMFPFAGMPVWAQWIGEALPLTHYIRIVRAIMLKGVDAGGSALRHDRAVRADAGRDDDRGDAVQTDAGLTPSQRPARKSVAVVGVGRPAGGRGPFRLGVVEAGQSRPARNCL